MVAENWHIYRDWNSRKFGERNSEGYRPSFCVLAFTKTKNIENLPEGPEWTYWQVVPVSTVLAYMLVSMAPDGGIVTTTAIEAAKLLASADSCVMNCVTGYYGARVEVSKFECHLFVDDTRLRKGVSGRETYWEQPFALTVYRDGHNLRDGFVWSYKKTYPLSESNKLAPDLANGKSFTFNDHISTPTPRDQLPKAGGLLGRLLGLPADVHTQTEKTLSEFLYGSDQVSSVSDKVFNDIFKDLR